MRCRRRPDRQIMSFSEEFAYCRDRDRQGLVSGISESAGRDQGKATLSSLCFFASSRNFCSSRKQFSSPLAPSCQTGPTVWITYFAGSLYPLVILASRPCTRQEPCIQQAAPARLPCGSLRRSRPLQQEGSAALTMASACTFSNVISDYFKRHSNITTFIMK